MKPFWQRLSVLFLAGLLLCSIPIAAHAQGRTDLPVPVVLIHGMGDDIVNENGENVYTRQMPKNGLAAAVKECVPLLLKALMGEREADWKACRKKIVSLVLSCFGPFFLDKNGEASDGTRAAWDWAHGNLPNLKTETGYGWEGYDFYYDWRLDPFALAKSLSAYIRDVKKATGSEKVDVLARSAGNLPLIAYLEKYGYEDVRCVAFEASPIKGMDLASSLMSGKLNFTAASLLRYKQFGDETQLEDALWNEAINLMLGMAYDVMALDLAVLPLNHVCKRIYTEILIPLLRRSYATFPSVWAMVDEEDFEGARDNVFSGFEKKYAGLLKKIDRYDKRVRRRVDEIILNAQKAGVKVAVLAKYGNYQSAPVGKHKNDINDNMIALTETSFGATVAKFGETLPVARRLWTRLLGKTSYVSPDKLIDASTCLLPDTTWFVYGVGHAQSWFYVEDFICGFFAANGKLTVFDDPNMPQYVLDNGASALEPMTAENAPRLQTPKHLPNSGSGRWKLARLVKVAFKLLRRKQSSK